MAASGLVLLPVLSGYLSLILLGSSCLLLGLPNGLSGKLPAPLRAFRNKLLGYCRRARELSVEGPFYRLAIWLGRKVGQGKLSSKCQGPDVRLKASGCLEVQVTMTPHLPYNPFHEENYVVAWCRADGKEWCERSLHKEHDCEKVGAKLRTFIDSLPERTLVQVRACAENTWGRSDWGKTAEVETLARPTDDGGFTGPLGPACGSGARYTWTQTRTEVFVKIPLAAEVKSRDIRFKCIGPKLEVHLVAGDGTTTEMLVGALHKKVKADEVFWTIEDPDKKYGRHLSIQLLKVEALQKWPCLIDADGHTNVDTRLIRFFTGDPENMSDLSGLSGLR
mmetsp:Transcript_9236/g.23746  ORF Transcript_9236/g.23746 Transcript_9236/m.23746 type:complete len:335 (-) Transcript_9236:60-1064(-)